MVDELPTDRPADIRLTLQSLQKIVALLKQLRERAGAGIAAEPSTEN